MAERVLVKELPHKGLQDLDHHCSSVGAHVCHGGCAAHVQQDLQGRITVTLVAGTLAVTTVR